MTIRLNASARSIFKLTLLLGVASGFASGCSSSSRLVEPKMAAAGRMPLFEDTPADFAPSFATSMRKIRARSCRQMTDRNAARQEIDASLRQQAFVKGANAVVRIKYKEFIYNNRGSCRPGLIGIGTPVVLRAAR